MATGPSRRAARLGVTIIAVTMPPHVSHPVSPSSPGRARAHLWRRALALLLGMGLGLALLVSCGGSGGPEGAALPARSGAGGPGGESTATGPAATPTPDVSAPAAVRTVETYFQEINNAVRAGRLAVITSTALEGCQACALDVGVSRSLAQRGLHADSPAYQPSDITARPQAGLAATVAFTLRTATVGLLDAAGRHVEDAAGAPTRAATAQLALTANGWRIQTLRYTTAPS